MAGDMDKTKQVFFIGAWRTQQVTDQLLRQISNQIGTKKKVLTNLSISAEGLELHILNQNRQVTRKDKIALENIVDFIDNKYSTTCTLAIVRDKPKRQYTVFVFQCMSDRDASVLIHDFKITKRQLSGEGYNTNLTPKGRNWTLQQQSGKKEHQQMNGDLKGRTVVTASGTDIRVINTEKQNGDVLIHSPGRSDSISTVKTSESEVKEELHHLAGEVRDIKRLLQGSKGRSQFENHYGYRIAQTLPVSEIPRHIEYIERDVKAVPVEAKRENIYVKNEANTRYVENAVSVNRVGRGVARSTRRFKTKGHILTATSPTRAEYTKRVYESTNPYVETGQRVQPVRVMTRNVQPVVVQRPRMYQSQSSDVIQKNIEDVYRSRSLRKIYISTSLNNNVVDYVNHQATQPVRHVPVKSSLSRESEQNAVHVKYSPDVRTYYETTAVDATADPNTSNVSTKVETYINDNVEYKIQQAESSDHIQQNEPIIQRDDNVVVVKTVIESPPQNSNGEERYHDVYVQDRKEEQQLESDVIGGNVYHVRAEFADQYDNRVLTEENVTVIKADNSELQRDNIVVTERTEMSQNDEHTTSRDEYTSNENTSRHHTTTGLFGAYVRTPGDFGEPEHEVVAEEAYRYHEDDLEIQESKADELHSRKEDTGLFGGYTEHVEESGEPGHDIVREKTVTFYESEVKIEENGAVHSPVPVTMESLDSVEERHVRYNDTIEQIPTAEDHSEHVIGAVRSGDVYNVGTQSHTEDDQFKNELSTVILNLRHRTDENMFKKVDQDMNGDEDEKYEFDMEAFNAYAAEPDIVIVDASKEKTSEFVTFDEKQPVFVSDIGESSNMDQAQGAISDKIENLEESKYEITEKLESNVEQFGSRVEGLEESTSGITEKVESNVERFGDKVESLDDSTSGITEKVESNVERFGDKVESLEESTSGITEKVESNVEGFGNKVESLEESTSGITEKVESNVERFGNNVESMKESTSGITEKVESNVERFGSAKDEIIEITRRAEDTVLF